MSDTYPSVYYGMRKAIRYKRSIGVNIPKIVADFEPIKKGDKLYVYYPLDSQTILISKLDIDKIEDLLKVAERIFLTFDRKFKRAEIKNFDKDIKDSIF